MQKYGQIAIEALTPYERNARTHSEAQVEKIANSIREFGFLNPVLIDSKNMIIAGHGRVLAAKKLGYKEVPCLRVEDLTETQIRAYILADNKLAEEAGWDELLLSQELAKLQDEDFNIELTGFESVKLDDWFNRQDKDGEARQEGNEAYNEFLDKFETAKTTDDCYTPQNIYDAVAGWVEKEYKVKRAQFLRPFKPEGNYQKEKYPSGCIVVDNPPFSILAEILRWYTDHKVKFFLFGPSLTIITATNCDLTYITCGAQVTYENGANVSTGFITNLDKEYRLRTAPDLWEAIKEQNDINLREKTKELPNFLYPDYVIAPAQIMKIAHYGQDLRIKKADSVIISELDEQKAEGKALFGKGLLLSEKAAAEKAAAEKAAAEKAAAEKAAARVWQLSEREMRIVKSLGKEESNGNK